MRDGTKDLLTQYLPSLNIFRKTISPPPLEGESQSKVNAIVNAFFTRADLAEDLMYLEMNAYEMLKLFIIRVQYSFLDSTFLHLRRWDLNEINKNDGLIWAKIAN